MRSELVRERVRTVLFMTAVTFVAITLVGAVDIATRSAVERNRTLFIREAVADAAGLDRLPSTDALLAWYDQQVTEMRNAQGDLDAFRVRDAQSPGNGADTLVLITRGPGLWGEITAFVGFDAGGTIRGVNFQDHVETPGLGARIDEPWFRRQFVGKSGPFTSLGSEPRNKDNPAPDPDRFDQITGATITSTAVKEIMNTSIQRARQIADAR